jgi:hypothetical protein
VSEFASKWLNFPEMPKYSTLKTLKSSSAGFEGSLDKPSVAVDTTETYGKSTISSGQEDALLFRLQAGSQWLTAQHQAWLEGRVDVAEDEPFSAALEAWDLLEGMLRQVFSYGECIFGLNRRCPGEAPGMCDFCVES